MTYDEIMNIGDLEEQENLLKEFYFDKIKIDKWLINDYPKQFIKFHDRTEYKFNNKYHNLHGPAIDYNDDNKDEYYIFGEKMIKTEWSSKAKNEILKLKIKTIKNT